MSGRRIAVILAVIAGIGALVLLIARDQSSHARTRQLALAATSVVKTTPPAPALLGASSGRREAVAASSGPMPGLVRLPGEMTPGLASVAAGGASRSLPVTATELAQPLTVTLTLRRTDQAGFERFLARVENPRSPLYRHFLTQAQLAARFGPTSQAYDSVLSWLRSQGFSLVRGSANRLTITVKGTRAQATHAFHTPISDFRTGARTVFANSESPALPRGLAPHVQAISGLSNLATPLATPTRTPLERNPLGNSLTPDGEKVPAACYQALKELGISLFITAGILLAPEVLAYLSFELEFGGLTVEALEFWGWGGANANGLATVLTGGLTTFEVNVGQCMFQLNQRYWSGGPNKKSSGGHRSLRARAGAADPSDPTQKIGLLEFDTFHASDVADWLNYMGLSSSIMNQLSEVPVNGGVGSPGPGESEVLLDIDTAIGMEPSPSTQYVVYDAPPSTSFETLFNAMIDNGDTVISNSWSQCEDQTPLAEAQAIDSVLAQAAAGGITVINGAGDHGSTCADGSRNTVGVPADSPNATAVGGTSPHAEGEIWWDGSTHTPPSGEGGFGVSKDFPRPSYQSGLTSATGRSVPDIAINADPAAGVQICQADAGGCPNGLSWGGTSMAAPALAAMVALLNQELGQNVGDLNTAIYPLAGTEAFNPISGATGNFEHVGLGSPDFTYVLQALTDTKAGPVSAANSQVFGNATYADGTTQGFVQVNLLDEGGYPVSDKAVSLSASGCSNVKMSPASGLSDKRGVVTFITTDTVPETCQFIATDTTDHITLSTQPEVTFVPPVAAGGEIGASPTIVADNGTAKTTVSVYLENALGRPAAGKTVKLADGESYAEITPSDKETETNAEGVATFTASDLSEETVSFTATDVTDENLPVPGSATVTFEYGGFSSCSDKAPSPISGFLVAPWVSGIPYNPQPLYFPGVEFYACQGPAAPAFDASGNAYVSDSISGEIYVLGLAGGSVGTAGKLPNAHFPDAELGQLTFGKEGSLYAGLGNTSGDFYEPEVVQLDPSSGEVLRVLATTTDGLQICPYNIATDPLTGDLFTTDGCTGAAGKYASDITRIEKPESASPKVSDYVNLPSFGGVQSSGLAFAPDGTLFVALPGDDKVVEISATDVPGTPTVTPVATLASAPYGVAIATTGAKGEATALDVTDLGGEIVRVDLTKGSPESETIASGGGDLTGAALGPDGCVYISDLDRLLRLSGSSGCAGPATGGPEIALTSGGPSPALTGTSVTVTAQLQNFSSAANTPVTFVVTGANSQVKLVHADAEGKASFSLPGVLTGGDQIEAFAANAGGTVTSAPLSQRWISGRDTSFLSLNGSQESGLLGQPATFTASLTDISTSEPSPIAGASVQIAVGTQSCVVTTDSSGVGSCTLTSPGGQALDAVTASYAGSASYTPSTASDAFAAGGVGLESMGTPISTPSPSPSPSPSPTPSPTPTPMSTVVKKAAVRPLAEVLGLPPATQCVSKRELVVHVHAPPGQQLLSVKLSLRGKVLRSLKYTKGHGHKIPSTVVDLKGLPKGTYTLKIVVHTKSGKTYTATRTYHTCVPKKTSHKKTRRR